MGPKIVPLTRTHVSGDIFYSLSPRGDGFFNIEKVFMAHVSVMILPGGKQRLWFAKLKKGEWFL